MICGIFAHHQLNCLMFTDTGDLILQLMEQKISLFKRIKLKDFYAYFSDFYIKFIPRYQGQTG